MFQSFQKAAVGGSRKEHHDSKPAGGFLPKRLWKSVKTGDLLEGSLYQEATDLGSPSCWKDIGKRSHAQEGSFATCPCFEDKASSTPCFFCFACQSSYLF